MRRPYDIQSLLLAHQTWVETKGRLGRRIRFFDNDLSNIDFSGRDLSYSEFRSSNLENANFNKTNLTCALIQESSLNNVNIHGADITRTKFTGTSLQNIKGILSLRLESGLPVSYVPYLHDGGQYGVGVICGGSSSTIGACAISWMMDRDPRGVASLRALRSLLEEAAEISKNDKNVWQNAPTAIVAFEQELARLSPSNPAKVARRRAGNVSPP